MKIQVGRNELLSALQSVIGVVERRQTLPVLGNFLLDVADDVLTVTGTDLEMELIGRARVQNLAPGRTTVPARKLFDICRGLPEGAELTLEAAADKVTVRSGKSRFTLSSLRADEFPSMGAAPGGVAHGKSSRSASHQGGPAPGRVARRSHESRTGCAAQFRRPTRHHPGSR